MSIIQSILPAKNIMVYDVAASTGGALSILADFYMEVLNHKDKTKTWTFVLGIPTFEATENIKILRYPWVKKSWLHRLYFEYFIVPNLIKKHRVDKVFSLQNVVVPRTDLPQVLYVHQPLPFVDYRFRVTENFRYWVYQNLIGRMIIESIKRADKVIVQTKWMKIACCKKTRVDESKFEIITPTINVKPEKYFDLTKENMRTFFYPAAAILYKNHKLIIEACKLLINNENVRDFKVIFTIKGNENKKTMYLLRETSKHNLPINFVGPLARKQVFDLYTKSVLLFPSYIETLGLPLVEAKIHNSPILASDSQFSHEILDDYGTVDFFNYSDAKELAHLMLKKININFES